MRIAIVDDEIKDREHLLSLLEHYCSTRNVSAEFFCFSSGEDVLNNFQPGYFQCIFLDIFMGGIDGMATARKIYQQDSSCRLIFSTSSISHAVTSYEVRAAWYLTKPISILQLTNAMNAACADILKKDRTLFVHIKGTELTVGFNRIFYIDCANRQACLHLQDRVLKIDESISGLLKTLSEDERFLICNRNTIVNLDHIELAEDHDFLMKDGSRVPIRQRGRAAVKKVYLAWTLKELRKEALL